MACLEISYGWSGGEKVELDETFWKSIIFPKCQFLSAKKWKHQRDLYVRLNF